MMSKSNLLLVLGVASVLTGCNNGKVDNSKAQATPLNQQALDSTQQNQIPQAQVTTAQREDATPKAGAGDVDDNAIEQASESYLRDCIISIETARANSHALPIAGTCDNAKLLGTSTSAVAGTKIRYNPDGRNYVIEATSSVGKHYRFDSKNSTITNID